MLLTLAERLIGIVRKCLFLASDAWLVTEGRKLLLLLMLLLLLSVRVIASGLRHSLLHIRLMLLLWILCLDSRWVLTSERLLEFLTVQFSPILLQEAVILHNLIFYLRQGAHRASGISGRIGVSSIRGGFLLSLRHLLHALSLWIYLVLCDVGGFHRLD